MSASIKTFYQKIKATPGYGSEHEQAIVRVIFSFLVFVYLSYNLFSTGNIKDTSAVSHALLFSGLFLLVSIILTATIFLDQKMSEKRQLLSMIADIGSISYAMYISGEVGSLFFGIYLWVTVGNGLRYGSRSLLRAQLLSVLGFSTVVLYNDYWFSHRILAVGLLLTLISIPLFTFFLLERLNRAITLAEEANRAKSQFLAHMSHEMRTPLNGVIGASELILGTPLNSEQKDLVKTLRSSGHLLLKLIENVLDFSKIESGKLVSEQVDFDLHAIVNSTVEMFTFQAKNKGIRLIKNFSPDVSYLLRGDAQHLRQIIINLVGNAIKFTPVGSVEVRVTSLDQHIATTRLRFEVIDTGIGIPLELQSSIFDSFTQAHVGIGNYGGTGLGTTISKQLVELMGGQIDFHSVPEKGSIFWFEVLFEKQNTFFTTEPSLSLDQIHVFGMGMSQAEQVSLVDTVASWGVQFSHANSTSQLSSLIDEKLSSGRRNLCILCRPQVLGMGAQDFGLFVESKYASNAIPLLLIASNPGEYTASKLFNWGYSSYLRTPIDRKFLFNALHALFSSTSTSENAIPTLEKCSLIEKKLNILVAEDNAINLKIISKVLESAEHQVDLVENGEQALDMLEEKHYDLAIFDMQMPVMTGIEAIKIYRLTERQVPRMPIIILTANATLEAKRECEEVDVDAFLTKPINAATLLDTIAVLTQNLTAPKREQSYNRKIPQVLFDENALIQLRLLATGDDHFVESVCQGFFLEGDKTLRAMQETLSKGQYNSFKELAHSMKGSAGNVGADTLSEICREILTLSYPNFLAQAEALMTNAQSSFNKTKVAITEYLDKNRSLSTLR